MKKYILVLIMTVSPLIGQENTEKETKKGIDYKRPVFGLNIGIGGGGLVDVLSGGIFIQNRETKAGGMISLSFVPEFYAGKQRKVYFYTRLPLYGYIFPTILQLDQIELGVLIGMGGYIKEADKYNPWSVVMNGALGPAMAYRFNYSSIPWTGYASLYLSLDIRYHTKSNYAVQFGINSNILFGVITQMGFSINTQLGLVF
ncbi:MAG: hypothetical protein ACRCTQ_00465 [Brevinemataceae bacterium]